MKDRTELTLHDYRQQVKKRGTGLKRTDTLEPDESGLNALKQPKRKHQPEYQLQKEVCAYLKTQYKGVLFLSDTVAAVKLNFGQQARNKAIQLSSFHCPDLLIFEPRRGFHGLFIEIKVKSPFKKDGTTLLKDDHLQNQWNTILDLNKRGYYAQFAWGFDMIKKVIDDHMA